MSLTVSTFCDILSFINYDYIPSEDTAMPKSISSFLDRSLRHPAAPENCYVLEDSHNGIRAAAAAGMHPIMVPDLLEPTVEMQKLAETICPSLNEAIDYLRRRLP